MLCTRTAYSYLLIGIQLCYSIVVHVDTAIFVFVTRYALYAHVQKFDGITELGKNFANHCTSNINSLTYDILDTFIPMCGLVVCMYVW